VKDRVISFRLLNRIDHRRDQDWSFSDIDVTAGGGCPHVSLEGGGVFAALGLNLYVDVH